MDAAPSACAITATPPPAGVPPPLTLATPPSKTPDVVAAWPRCAQLAAAFVVGSLTSLLGVQVLASIRSGEPAERDGPIPLTYRVDLNEARRSELRQLPGVGPTLAQRIDEYRDKHGGFRSVDDLLKVPGIGRTTLEKIRPFVTVGDAAKPAEPRRTQEAKPAAAPPAKKEAAANSKVAKLQGQAPIDVNRAALAELQKLPGIGPKMSQRIVEEREKRPFATVDELRRVTGIGPKTLDKLRPYVTVGK